MTVILVVVATTLLVLLIPYTVEFIAWSCCLDDVAISEPALQEFTFEIGFDLCVVNNAVNFFLYLASGSKFRTDVLKLFRCRGEKHA